MIRVFYGDDRAGARAQIEKVLGDDYEVVEGEALGREDLPSLFLGTSLFSEERRILVKDLGGNAICWGELVKYLDTSHRVVVWESKLDKRTATYKSLQKRRMEVREFKLAEAPEKKLVFEVFDTAWRGETRRAVEMVGRIETTNDPFMFVGLMVSQAMRRLEAGERQADKVVKLLARYDMRMKSASMQPWILVKAMVAEIAEMRGQPWARKSSAK